MSSIVDRVRRLVALANTYATLAMSPVLRSHHALAYLRGGRMLALAPHDAELAVVVEELVRLVG